jgi:dTDP-4-dehydrorhamnose reductase
LKLLVVGKEGQLARSLREASPPHGLQVSACGRPACDLADAGSISAALDETRPDVVVNAAAYTAVDQAEREPEAARAVNAIGAGHLAAACERRGAALIHVSTDYVYDGCKDSPYVEEDRVVPVNAYGQSKLEGEELVTASCSRYLILRTAWVYSPFGHNFLRTMLRLADSRPEIAVVDDQHGCPTYAPHLANAILTICAQLEREESQRPRWGVYHAAASGETTWCGFAREIFRCSAAQDGPAAKVRPIPASEYPTPAKRPANSRLDCSKLSRAFGVQLPDWRDGTAECVTRLLAARSTELERGRA